MRFRLALLFLLGLCASPVQSVEPERHALLVAISEYERGDPDADWWNLNCAPDVAAIRELLIRRFDFTDDEITVLDAPEQTTRAGIVSAFREQLIAAAKPGDLIYFHYSGHGSELPDQDGDELDGLDECLVPSDYVSRQDGSGNLRDDTLAGLLEELAATGASNVTLSFDCCFSGTATRAGRTLLRGRGWEGPAAVRGAEEDATTAPVDAGDFVVLSATSQGQTAGEYVDDAGRSMGLFSHALIRAAAELGSEATYRDLYESLAGFMARETRTQTPQLEGRFDRLLFGTGIRPPTPYLSLSVDGDKLFLEAGTLQGQTTGSIFALHAAGTRDFDQAKPLARAKVIFADLNYAELELLDPLPELDVLAAGRAVEQEHAYGDGRLALHIGPGVADQMATTIDGLSIVKRVGAEERWDLRLSRTGGSMRIERQDGSELNRLAPDAELAEIEHAIQGEARWRFLAELSNRDPYSQVSIELRMVAVEPDFDAEGYVSGPGRDIELARSPSGRLLVPAGTHVMLELRNPGYVDAYVTVFDLRGDGGIGPLWPYPGLRIQDNRVAADGRWHRKPYPYIFALEGEAGPETFKAIATAEPADFSPLVDPELLAQRGPGDSTVARSPLGRLLGAMSLGERSVGGTVVSGNWATAAVEFELVERD
jgi:metacaspase-1